MKKLILFFALTLSVIGFSQSEKFTLVIDAGHGGKDEGAQFENQKEAELILQFSKELVAVLQQFEDLNVLTTRNNNSEMSLDERVKFINENQANAVISLHLNNAKSNDTHGTEAWITENEYKENSQFFAENMTNILSQYNLENRGVKTANFKILTGVNCPAVTLELGFISNASDREILTGANRENLIHALAKYILLSATRTR